jgi:class 3 adenylate cyclase/tetratricopeptide (TPR) repeat protein
MKPDNRESKIDQLKQAIAAQEGMRGKLDDAIIDATIGALQAQLAELEGESKPEQQRKLMTVLFMDIVNSTQMMRDLDPEDNMAIMDAALKRLAEPIVKRGGRVLRFLGDGYLAVFGLPFARENDAEMAVRAGLDVLKIAKAVAANLENEDQIPRFQVRVGVNSGLVVAGGETEGEDTIMGSAVNLAARLESSAPAGGFLISHNTYQHVRGLFEVEPQKAIRAKGFAKPVKSYLVRRAKQFTFNLTTRGVEGIETRMIGRVSQLTALQKAYSAIVEGGGARFVTVIGEAGLGKSRLLAEFERWLNTQASEFELFKVRATLETLNWPYGLLRDMIATRVGILEDDSIVDVREKILASFRDVNPRGEHLERNAHIVGQLLGYDFRDSPYLKDILNDPRQIHDRALAYLMEYLNALSQVRLLVIFLDDVHWADSSSLEALQNLFGELESHPMLVVALTRQTLFERQPEWGTLAGHQQLVLKPLSRLQSQRLVADVLKKVQDLPDRLRDLIIENAEGNPFYLEELIKMLVEDGVIVKDEPLWRIRTDLLGEMRIPPTLTGVIQARLDSLPSEQRRILQQASVVGRVFWDEVVCHISQDADPGELVVGETKRNLGRLEDREMIYYQETSVFSGVNEYLFKHAILRDVTYESVLKRVRRVYHALVADWLIAHSGDRIDEVTGLIAGHLENADNKEQALEYMQRAAELAHSNYALVEAVDFYTRALALVSEDNFERRYVLLKGRTAVFESQGNRDAQRKDLESSAEIAELLDDNLKQVEVSNKRAWYAYFTGDFPEAIMAANRTIELAKPAGLTDYIAEAHRVLVWANRQLDDFEAAVRHAEIGLALSQKSSDRNLQSNFQSASGLIQLVLGNYSAARRHSEKALALSEELGNISARATYLSNSGVVLTVLGDYEDAESRYHQGLDIAIETTNRTMQATVLINLAWVNAALGRWEQAREYGSAGAELCRSIAYVEPLAESLMWLGHAWVGLGRPKKATTCYQEAYDIRRELGQTNLAMGAQAGLARAALAAGDHALALEHVEEIIRHLAKGGNLAGTWEPLRIHLVCYRVLEAVDDPRAEEILETAYNDLQERAARITNARDSKLYLGNVSWHREILSAWKARSA